MKNGFWEIYDHDRSVLEKTGCPNDIDFGFLGSIDCTPKDQNIDYCMCAYDFLHGDCNAFADYLKQKYKYKVEAVFERRELVHMYCIAEKNGKAYYIDIRGITDDFDEFMQEFYDLGLWANDDDTAYRLYKRIPHKFKADKVAWSAAKLIDHSYDYYNIKNAA